jgi:dihydroorotate dehydrogenase electron transfer subunit
MFSQSTAKVVSLTRIKPDVFLLRFISKELAKKCHPGNFLHIKIPPALLRRPFSIHDVRGNDILVLFRVRGKGTLLLSKYKKGDSLNILGPLGKGFIFNKRASAGRADILVAGGIGVAPLLFLAQKLKKSGAKNISVLLGVKSRSDLLCADDFKKLGIKVFVASDDGSCGFKGNVVLLLKNILSQETSCNIYCCGPSAMFKPVYDIIQDRREINCQVSFEQFMGCGIGTCCGCTIETALGYKKTCKDGPVFDIHTIFDDR